MEGSQHSGKKARVGLPNAIVKVKQEAHGGRGGGTMMAAARVEIAVRIDRDCSLPLEASNLSGTLASANPSLVIAFIHVD